MLRLTPRKANRPLAEEDYLAMCESERSSAATAHSSATTAGAGTSSTHSSEPVAPLSTLRPPRRSWIARLFGRRSAAPAGGAADFRSQRRQWAAERQMLLDDCTAVRTQARELERVLGGWSSLVRDLLFYSLLYGKKAELLEFFHEQLRESIGEVEGVHEVEITELRLPSSSEHAPQIALLEYTGPDVSEWTLKWEPPSTQCGGSITLRGRRFGVSFTLVVAVSALRVQGLIVCKWSPEAAEPVLASPRLASPRLASTRLASPRLRANARAPRANARAPNARTHGVYTHAGARAGLQEGAEAAL